MSAGYVSDWWQQSTSAIESMIRRNPDGDDRWVADHVNMLLRPTRTPPVVPMMVAEQRLVIAGAMPKVGHDALVRALTLHAWHFGYDAHPEHSISLGGRSWIRPDLIVAEGDTIRWIVEVKSHLGGPAACKAAAAQAARYVEVTGGEPIVTTYAQPPVDRIGDVRFLSASAVRATFAAARRAEQLKAA